MRKVEEDIEKLEELMEVLDIVKPEFDQLNQIRLIWQQIQDITQKQQELIKQDLKMLATLVEEEEMEMKSDTKGEKYVEKEGNVKAEMAEARQQKDQIKQQCNSVKEEMNKCHREQTHLLEKRKMVDRDTKEILPTYRYDVNLYNRIFKIRWQYDSEPDEVCGYVCNKADVKPFSLNSKQHSQFFITNYLWDLIEEETPVW